MTDHSLGSRHNAVSTPFPHAFTAERIRLFSTPGWIILLALAVLLPAGATAALVTAAGGPGGADPSTTEGLRTTLSSGFMAALIAAIFGALTVTNEFRHGTSTMSIFLARSRWRWLQPKLVLAAAIGLLYTTLGELATLCVGILMLQAKNVAVPDFSGIMIGAVAGTCALGALAAVLGVGVGLLCKSQVGSIVALIIYNTVVEEILLQVFPSVGRYLPGGALSAITDNPSVTHLPMFYGYVVYVAWAAAILAAGSWRLHHQDVP